MTAVARSARRSTPWRRALCVVVVAIAVGALLLTPVWIRLRHQMQVCTAVQRNDARALQLLLTRVATENEPCPFHWDKMSRRMTPLMLAIQHDSDKCVSVLAERGVDVTVSNGGHSPLFWAVFFRSERSVDVLLQLRALESESTESQWHLVERALT